MVCGGCSTSVSRRTLQHLVCHFLSESRRFIVPCHAARSLTLCYLLLCTFASCLDCQIAKTAAPIFVNSKRTQIHFPENATGTCKVCGGTLTVSIEDAGTEVSIDQVFLEPGECARMACLCLGATTHLDVLVRQWNPRRNIHLYPLLTF